MGNWTHLMLCARLPYYPFVDESHDRLIDAPKTDEITVTNPVISPLQHHFASSINAEKERGDGNWLTYAVRHI
jgi:hypothetical protein